MFKRNDQIEKFRSKKFELLTADDEINKKQNTVDSNEQIKHLKRVKY